MMPRDDLGGGWQAMGKAETASRDKTFLALADSGVSRDGRTRAVSFAGPRQVIERLECTEVPQGLSVTRTPFADYWRLRVGQFMAKVRAPKVGPRSAIVLVGMET